MDGRKTHVSKYLPAHPGGTSSYTNHARYGDKSGESNEQGSRLELIAGSMKRDILSSPKQSVQYERHS